jgi:glycine/serine hydroxymethyltransferase
MASKRTTTQVLRTASRIRFQPPAAIAQRSTFIQHQSWLVARPPQLLRSTARAYSQASQQKKIWNFEDIQKIAQEAKPSVTIIGKSYLFSSSDSHP